MNKSKEKQICPIHGRMVENGFECPECLHQRNVLTHKKRELSDPRYRSRFLRR